MLFQDGPRAGLPTPWPNDPWHDWSPCRVRIFDLLSPHRFSVTSPRRYKRVLGPRPVWRQDLGFPSTRFIPVCSSACWLWPPVGSGGNAAWEGVVGCGWDYNHSCVWLLGWLTCRGLCWFAFPERFPYSSSFPWWWRGVHGFDWMVNGAGRTSAAAAALAGGFLPARACAGQWPETRFGTRGGHASCALWPRWMPCGCLRCRWPRSRFSGLAAASAGGCVAWHSGALAGDSDLAGRRPLSCAHGARVAAGPATPVPRPATPARSERVDLPTWPAWNPPVFGYRRSGQARPFPARWGLAMTLEARLRFHPASLDLRKHPHPHCW